MACWDVSIGTSQVIGQLADVFSFFPPQSIYGLAAIERRNKLPRVNRSIGNWRGLKRQNKRSASRMEKVGFPMAAGRSIRSTPAEIRIRAAFQLSWRNLHPECKRAFLAFCCRYQCWSITTNSPLSKNPLWWSNRNGSQIPPASNSRSAASPLRCGMQIT